MEQNEQKQLNKLLIMLFGLMYLAPLFFVFVKNMNVFIVMAVAGNLMIVPTIMKYTKNNIVLLLSFLFHPSLTLITLGLGSVLNLDVMMMISLVLYAAHHVLFYFGMRKYKKAN